MSAESRDCNESDAGEGNDFETSRKWRARNFAFYWIKGDHKFKFALPSCVSSRAPYGNSRGVFRRAGKNSSFDSRLEDSRLQVRNVRRVNFSTKTFKKSLDSSKEYNYTFPFRRELE